MIDSASRIRLGIEVFVPVVDEEFSLALEQGGASVATLVLREVTPSKWATRPESGGFSLIFDGPAHPALGQKIYWLTHSQLGEHAIFLVPIGADEATRRYQAVFN